MWKSIDPIQFNGERERAYWMAFVVPSWTWHLLKGCSLGSLWLWLVFINFEWGREQETKFAAWSQLRDKGQRDSLANLALHSNFALYLELQPKLKANLIKFIHGDGGNDKCTTMVMIMCCDTDPPTMMVNTNLHSNLSDTRQPIDKSYSGDRPASTSQNQIRFACRRIPACSASVSAAWSNGFRACCTLSATIHLADQWCILLVC